MNILKWAIGGFFFYEFFLKEESVLGQEKKKIFVHVKIETPIERRLPRLTFAKTIPVISCDYEIYLDSGKYKVKLKEFKITSTIYISSDKSIFSHIKGFQPYHKANRNYAHSDFRSGFTTEQATIFHETLHQNDLDIILDQNQDKILKVFNSISDKDKNEVDLQAKRFIKYLQDAFDGTAGGKSFTESKQAIERHKVIELKHWKYMHDKYVEWGKAQ